MGKTTAKDFKYFQERCLYWQKKIGLQDWKLYFKHMPLKDAAARCSYNLKAANAVVKLIAFILKFSGNRYRHLFFYRMKTLFYIYYAPYKHSVSHFKLRLKSLVKPTSAFMCGICGRAYYTGLRSHRDDQLRPWVQTDRVGNIVDGERIEEFMEMYINA